MTEELSPKTFDLLAALHGATLPEDTVEIYTDEAGAYKIVKLNRELDRAELIGKAEEAKALLEEFESLRDQLRQSRLTFTVRGISKEVRKAITLKVLREFQETTHENEAEATLEAQEKVNALLWAAHLVKVEDASGAVAFISEENALEVVTSIPPIGAQEIGNVIDGFLKTTTAGVEIAQSDLDFSSAVSPEA